MNKNKKKYLIASAAFVVCFIMFVFAIKAQRMYAQNLTDRQEASQKSENKAANTKSNTDKAAKENAKAQDAKSNTTAAAQEAAKTDVSKKAASNSNSSSTSASQTSSPQQPAASTSVKVKQDDPDSQMNLQIIDTVNGNKIILQKDISSMDGETVGYIMERTLDAAKIKYKATGSASTLYFAAIDGLEEKKAGNLSGWCYYVKKKGDTKFHKPNVGSGQWIYHKGDVVVWKYLADGIHDGYEDDWGKSSF
ncbi:hypothetical protein Ccar_11630 [Clostridium carboxidivorans P7]|uniref:Transcobalamin-like C-terminal domain-containing protein n=1 Tax=Clostridium carboxidivorans P7 TaxID=536227 RepID=C6PRJ0_9CLOT|nr:DUF4430 domain-containing protein [Clostridium carboxidivorans]AKN31475.1 hypothetical protein Ccar_11630 [Clostridium carboxidivorans P7]EET88171.1 hypothetical protein CcarbDRAFT_1407 [Clostridium carboxidivorans P7]EFG87130.1 hypothetical protein CLCAR_3233 [Clostridium carboxidivorans P7]